MIDIDKLSVVFGEGEDRVLAVDQFSLRVEAGESFGLVGESGSGKSTVLRAVAGLVDTWTGDMVVDGAKLGRKRSRDFYAKVQMVFQDPFGSLHPKHTIDRILSEPLIARALVLNPRIILLDEPTSALDVSIQAEILNLLDDIRTQLGVTYLLVSHDLGVVAHMCNRFAVMRQGRLVEVAESGHLGTGVLSHAYSRQLLLASKGYDRALVDTFSDL